MFIEIKCCGQDEWRHGENHYSSLKSLYLNVPCMSNVRTRSGPDLLFRFCKFPVGIGKTLWWILHPVILSLRSPSSSFLSLGHSNTMSVSGSEGRTSQVNF